MKLKKGDKVKILLGKDRGKTGTVERVLEKRGELLVGGVNLYKKHVKPRGGDKQNTGGIIDMTRPLAMAKAALICPKCGKITRVGYSLTRGQKSRICRICKAEI